MAASMNLISLPEKYFRINFHYTTDFALEEKIMSQDHDQNGKINQILSLCTEHSSRPWQLQPEIHLKYWSNTYN